MELFIKVILCYVRFELSPGYIYEISFFFTTEEILDKFLVY